MEKNFKIVSIRHIDQLHKLISKYKDYIDQKNYEKFMITMGNYINYVRAYADLQGISAKNDARGKRFLQKYIKNKISTYRTQLISCTNECVLNINSVIDSLHYIIK